MHRFGNILVVLDRVSAFDDNLLQGKALAERDGAQLTLAVCLQEFGNDGDRQDLQSAYVDQLRDRLDELADGLSAAGTDASAKLLFGRPSLEVIVQVLHVGHDLVIKTAQRTGAVRPSPLGATDLHLLRDCPCPVWILPPSGADAGVVLAAVDTATATSEDAILNDSIIETALALAAMTNAPVHLVHAWSLSLVQSVLKTPWLNVAGGSNSARVREQVDVNRRRFDDFVARHRLAAQNLQFHYVEGEPEDIIPALARDLDAGVIVMGTESRSGVPELLDGNTVEVILTRVDCSVLAIKPPDFKTPVAI